MRKTTLGRRIVHIKTERVIGYISKSFATHLKIGKFFEVEKGKSPAKTYAEAERYSMTQVHPIHGRPIEMICFPKIEKTSRPHRLR